jgi:hypothetical protein
MTQKTPKKDERKRISSLCQMLLKHLQYFRQPTMQYMYSYILHRFTTTYEFQCYYVIPQILSVCKHKQQ